MKNFVVFGCGRFGSTVASTLFELGNEVLTVDIDGERVQAISDMVTTSVQCDLLDEHATGELGLKNFDVAIVAIGDNLEAAIMSVLIAREAGIETIVAKAATERKGEILSRVGATKVVYPEREMGLRLAHHLMNKNILDIISFSDEYSVAEIRVTKMWEGKSIGDLDFRKNYGGTIIAIRSLENQMIIDPSAHTVLRIGDQVIVLGSNSVIKELEKLD